MTGRLTIKNKMVEAGKPRAAFHQGIPFLDQILIISHHRADVFQHNASAMAVVILDQNVA